MFYKKVQFSSVLMMLMIFWFLIFLNLNELSLNKIPLMSKNILNILFIIQICYLIIFIFKNRNINIKKFKILKCIPQFTCCLLIIIFISSGFYQPFNFFFKLEIVIFILELILVRVVEIVSVSNKIFSNYNTYFSPKYKLELIKNKKFKPIYYKGNKRIVEEFFKVLFLYFIFIFLWILIFRQNLAPMLIKNFIILFFIIFITNPKNMLILDKLTSNFIVIECICIQIKNSTGAHSSGISRNYFINDSLKFKTHIDVKTEESFKKNQKVQLVVGGISHFVIDIN